MAGIFNKTASDSPIFVGMKVWRVRFCRKVWRKPVNLLESAHALLKAEVIGASEGIRTLDVHLGKVMLYQTELRSLPKKCRYGSPGLSVCKDSFSRQGLSG